MKGTPIPVGKAALLAASLLAAACTPESGDSGQAGSVATPAPVSFNDIQVTALNAMGATGLTRLAFGGNGWEACLGQPWRISEGWARWTITDYSRVIDYATLNSLQTAQRQAGMDPDRLGGCGAQPNAAVQNQQSAVNIDSPWVQQLQVWLTPVGFLALAQQQGAQVAEDGDGLKVTVEVPMDGIDYRVEGAFGDDYLLDRVLTHVDGTVYGALEFAVEFSDWRDFDGLLFPARIVQRQGGYTTLDLAITGAVANTTASAEPPPRQGGGFGGGPQAADLPAFEAIGDGIWALHGAYQSVVMEFADYSVVLDGLQNDARVAEIIRLARELVPGKPIGYVLVTHNHFDHASGLRQFVAEGATIITHETNRAFFENVLTTPRLDPAQPGSGDMPVNVLGVGDFHALDDGSQRVEFHKLAGSRHADDMLIAYIPSIRTIVESDLLQPWISPVFGGNGHPFLLWLADELDRVGLDYEQFVPVHRPPQPPLMTRADLMTAAGRQ